MSILEGKTVGLADVVPKENDEYAIDENVGKALAAVVQDVIEAIEGEDEADDVDEKVEAPGVGEPTEAEETKFPEESSANCEEQEEEKQPKAKPKKRKAANTCLPRRKSQRNLGKSCRKVAVDEGPIAVDTDEDSPPVPLAFKATLTPATKKQTIKAASEESREDGQTSKSAGRKPTLWVGPTFEGGFAGFSTTPVEQILGLLVKQVELLQEMVQELQTSHRVLLDKMDTMCQAQETHHHTLLEKLDSLTTEVIEEEIPVVPHDTTPSSNHP